MKENPSPEEKLLNLIRGTRQRDVPVSAKGAPDPAAKTDQRHPAVRRSVLSADFLFERFVWAAFLLSLGFALVSFLWPFLFPPPVKMAQPAGPAAAVASPSLNSQRKNLEWYQNSVGSRQIFLQVKGPDEPAPEESFNPELIKDLTLVGIISGENAQVIIEDRKALKTFSLNRGQAFGDFKVEEILENKAVLSYRGQKFELSL